MAGGVERGGGRDDLVGGSGVVGHGCVCGYCDVQLYGGCSSWINGA